MAETPNSNISSNQFGNTLQMQVIQPQNQLISTRLLDSNYLIWKQQVLTTIRGYGLEKWILGESNQPAKLIPEENEEGLRVNPEYEAWERQDQLLASWILSSLTDGILVLTVGLNTAREIWRAWEVNFFSQNLARQMQYKLQLQTMKKGSMPMKEFLNKMKHCFDCLASTGEVISQRDQVLQILSNLGSEYNPVVVGITSRVEPVTIPDAETILLSSSHTKWSVASFDLHKPPNSKRGKIEVIGC